MRFHEILIETSDSSFKFETTMRGHHRGQSDMTISVFDHTGQRVGYLDFSVLPGRCPAIQMIRAEKRGLGVGQALVKHLQSQFPDQEIDFGMTTEDGTNLLKRLPMIYIADPEYAEKKAELDRLHTENARWQQIADAYYADPHSLRKEAALRAIDTAVWNDVHDQIHQLQDQLLYLKPGKRLVQF